MRAKLSSLSVDTLGYDLTELPSIEADGPDDGFDEPAGQKQAESEDQTRTVRETLHLQSQTMRDLEQLVLAFDALETWAQRLDEYEQCVLHSAIPNYLSGMVY
jgi:nuclear pore complex protein Nup107